MLAALLLAFFVSPHAVRLDGNPIVTPASSPSLDSNINGPSLIRVPEWLAHPLGKYYLYFAHHQGQYIRLAYSNHLQGPWKIYEPGTLKIAEVPVCHDHIASPDVHVNNETHKILMYFHCPTKGYGTEITDQDTLLASSADGINFSASSQILGPAYFRVFRWQDAYYAVIRGGGLYRSKDGVSAFERGPRLFPKNGPLLRHTAVYLHGSVLSIYYSRIGDKPERILVSDVDLTPGWMKWKASAPQTVLEPEMPYEGADLPLKVSLEGEVYERVRELRDPAIYEEAGRLYLLYSIAGESGLAIAEIK